MNTTKRNLSIGLLAATFLIACGGTSPPSGSTGSPGTPGATGTTGSTGPTGAVPLTAGSRGVITGLSPLTVNGVRFDTGAAEIRIEGEKRTESELRKA